MLPRTLEPEVMDSAAEALSYDAMDHSQVNRRFVDDLLIAVLLTTTSRLRVLDVGTGTALIPVELARRFPDCHIVAADAARSMLDLADRHIHANGLSDRIETLCVDCRQIPFDDGAFDLVISNSIVHHIPRPLEVLQECCRILTPGGLLFVRDLFRPESSAEIERLVALYAGSASSEQQQLLRQSFHAALTVAEVQELVRSLGILSEAVQVTSDRHWTLCWDKPLSIQSAHEVG